MIELKRKTNVILLSSLGVYLLLYFIFYPKTYAIFDEACYLDLSYALKQGTIYLEKAGIETLHYPMEVGSHLVSRYPIGNSALLMPFTFLGSRGLFLFGLLFHLLSYLLFIKILKEADIDPMYAIFYLFYPPQVLFSRTLMSDIPGAFFFLLGFYAYQKEKYASSGMAFGVSFLIRYVNILFIPIFFIASIIRKKVKGLEFVAGFLPFLLFLLFYHSVAYGGMFKTGYTMEVSLFDIRGIGVKFGIYLLALGIFYPLMIFSPVFYKKLYRFEILASCIIMLLFYSFAYSGLTLYAQPSTKNIFKVVILAIRYFFPIVPLFLIAYFSVIKKYMNRIGFLTIWFGLIIVSFGIHLYHNKYLDTQIKFRDALYAHTDTNSIILCNGEVSELVSEVWGKRKLMIFEKEDIDFSLLPKENVWLASLIKFDRRGVNKFIAFKDSLGNDFSVELVEKIKSVDKRFELYEVK